MKTCGGSISVDERRLLIFRAAELSARGENSAVASSFLTPAEQRIVFEAQMSAAALERTFFWGGFLGAERRRAIFLPLWMLTAEAVPQKLFSTEREKFFLNLLEKYGALDILQENICTVAVEESGYVKLSHRDYLGALMALGIKRNVLGDIVTDGREKYLFCDKVCADFIIRELCRIGRDTVTCRTVQTTLDFSPVIEYEEVSVTAASLRVDGVVHALCRISRERAAQMIAADLVEKNYFAVHDADKKVESGDILSVRGFGKFIVDSTDEVTKKGRIRIQARKYV